MTIYVYGTEKKKYLKCLNEMLGLSVKKKERKKLKWRIHDDLNYLIYFVRNFWHVLHRGPNLCEENEHSSPMEDREP